VLPKLIIGNAGRSVELGIDSFGASCEPFRIHFGPHAHHRNWQYQQWQWPT